MNRSFDLKRKIVEEKGRLAEVKQVVKILHAGDFHLDAVRSSLKNPKLAARSREELRSTFLRTVETALSNGINVVLLAGDVFDGESASRSTVKLVKEAILKAPNIQFFIAPGNHDPLVQNSPYLIEGWPSNVHIFVGSVEKFDLPQFNLCVWGSGFTQGQQWGKKLADFKVDDKSKINIMVLHGEMTAEGGVTPYGPVTIGEIARSGLDYLALGHIHTASQLQKSGDTFYAYCGCPEGQGFDETGEKGVLIGTIEKGSAQLQFLPMAKRRYEIINVDLQGIVTTAQAGTRIREVAGELLSQHFIRAVLCGEVSAEISLPPSLIEKELEDAFYIELLDETTLSKDLDSLASEQSLQGIFVAKLLKRIKEAGNDTHARKTAELALKLGLAAMADEEVQVW